MKKTENRDMVRNDIWFIHQRNERTNKWKDIVVMYPLAIFYVILSMAKHYNSIEILNAI